MTRMERTRRKQRFLSVVGISAATMFLVAVTPEKQPEPQEMPEIVYFAPAVAEEKPVLEEAPVEVEVEEFNPVREDIPLDEDTQVLLYSVCEAVGIQYELALAVINQETDFRNIVGDGGASTGYMQIQQRWHEDRMERLGVTDLADPHGNFLVGCDYLAELIAKERGIEWALMAYNGGPSYANEMAKAGKVSKYAEDVLNYRNNLKMEEIKNGLEL